MTNMSVKSIFSILLIFLFISCSSTKQSVCPENPSYGNAGENINSSDDEYSPFIFMNSVHYLTKDKDKHIIGIYKANYFNGKLASSEIAHLLPLEITASSSSPSIFHDEKGNPEELFFSAPAAYGKKISSDIFCSKFDGMKWNNPIPVTGKINTEEFESNPAISPDGKFMVFTSDRQGGFGETDLYISHRLPDGDWTEPQNLGNGINTPEQEITPHIAPNGDLYYSSKGFTKNKDFNIIKGEYAGEGRWKNTKLLPFPINSEADEIFPLRWLDKILFSSNREGGCGGYDLYMMPYCGPVIAEGVINTNGLISAVGLLKVFDSLSTEIYKADIGDDGKFKVAVNPYVNYTFEYSNPCLRDGALIKNISVPCSDSSTVKMIMNFDVPKQTDEFSFENYKVPFFVSGYYLPNTTKNLDDLRRKFVYNLLGTSDSTKYIENPGPEYDKYAEIVDSALRDAGDFILKQLEFFKSPCNIGNVKLKILITGYADPRPISDMARYDGPYVDDAHYNLTVQRGTNIDNTILSTLRAYYTTKYLENLIFKRGNYQLFKEKIEWKIEGKGVDDREIVTNELKRHVDIKIGIEKE